MSGYINAMRWKMNLFVVVLVVVSYRVAGLNLFDAILPAITMFVGFGATMVQNDLRDRHHDRKKGKTHAADHPFGYRVFATILWLITLVLSLVLWQTQGIGLMYITLVAMAIGLAYSELLLVPGLPNLLVAVCSALAVSYPLVIEASTHTAQIWLLFVAVFGAVYGREILKDFEDDTIDAGHKWTWPVAKGEKCARRVAVIAYVIGTLPLFPLLPEGGFRRYLLLPLPGIVAAMKLSEGHSLEPWEVKYLKSYGDVGMAILLIVFAIFGVP